MSEELTSIYPRIIEEEESDEIYQELAVTVQLFRIEQFKDHIINKAVVLLDTKEDMIDFSVKAIDDEIEILKESNKEKRFAVFSEEMIAKVAKTQEFYTIIIQPYLFVQLKDRRDEYIQSLTATEEEDSPKGEESEEAENKES
jgi:hypothetical protein